MPDLGGDTLLNIRSLGRRVNPVNFSRFAIVNYAWKLDKGVQIGVVNIIRDNPKGLKVLPVFNAGF